MALVAMVRKQLVDKLRVLEDNQVLEGASLAALLPGPLAVNSVVYYGYVLKGIKGAFVSFFGVLLPTSLLVLCFAWFYFAVEAPEKFHIDYVIPAVAAIIAGVGIGMGRKQIRHKSQLLLAGMALLVSVLASHVFFLLGTIVIGGLAGYFLYANAGASGQKQSAETQKKPFRPPLKALVAILGILIIGLTVLALLTDTTKASFALASVFSGMSLTLFGGGYVIIPIMRQALVSDLNWVTLSEFNAAIGISQVTPGPILSSVTFIGFKLAGISGAITATLSIFLPSAVLMLMVANLHERIKHLQEIAAVMTGIRAVVIGLILSGAYSIGIKSFGVNYYAWSIFLIALGLSVFTKIHPALLIGITLLISFL
ncbi:MAG: hypothetical protein RLZZ241_2148 [Bacteroidota bacterium]